MKGNRNMMKIPPK